MIIVVLDACTDSSADIAACFPVEVIRTNGRCVGAARAHGAAHALKAGARWLAFTDADTEVSADWLTAQLALDSELVCGTVSVARWPAGCEALARRFSELYTDADGHRHIHGANLAISADTYRNAGGFAPLKAHEDVALVKAAIATGAIVAWSARPRVFTSGRLVGRAKEGFADYLHALARVPALPTVAPPDSDPANGG
jgi:hypothetical protein